MRWRASAVTAARCDHFRHRVARLRPRPAAQAYLRLRTLPGEQARSGLGPLRHDAHRSGAAPADGLRDGAVLLAHDVPALLSGRGDGLRSSVAMSMRFQALGVARILLYDNLKSAVLERVGDAIRFHPSLLELAAHYHFQPRPVAVARGNEKGSGGAFDPLCARELLCRPDLPRPRRPECAGERLVRRASCGPALPGAGHRLGARSVARRAAPTARLAREPLPQRAAPRGGDPQDTLCALRPQRLQRAAHLRAAQPHRVGRRPHGSHPRWSRSGRHPRALLRRRRPDRDRRTP